MTMAPDDLLAESRRLLDEPLSGTVSLWPRAAAVLARQALEDALKRFWAQRSPDIQWLNMRAQLNCLGVLAPPELARDMTFTWHELSRATHHHPYELDPTREELGSLIAAAQRLVDAIR